MTRIQSLINVYDKLFAKWLNAVNRFAELSNLGVWWGLEYASMV